MRGRDGAERTRSWSDWTAAVIWLFAVPWIWSIDAVMYSARSVGDVSMSRSNGDSAGLSGLIGGSRPPGVRGREDIVLAHAYVLMTRPQYGCGDSSAVLCCDRVLSSQSQTNRPAQR